MTTNSASGGVSVLDCVLKNDVALLIHAMETPQEESPIFNPYQHPPNQQIPTTYHQIIIMSLL